MKSAATNAAAESKEAAERGWRLSYIAEASEEMRMPEPQHRRLRTNRLVDNISINHIPASTFRKSGSTFEATFRLFFLQAIWLIGPAGVSSGVSLHELPKAQLEDLTKICQHYEQKCSGVYASDSAAARYLFQLSREVQQVAASLAQEISSRSRSNDKADNLSKEWMKSFGPDAPLVRDADILGIPLLTGIGGGGLGGAGKEREDDKSDGVGRSSDGRIFWGASRDAMTPADVAEALRCLVRRVSEAEKGAEEVSRDRASSVAGLREALDAHVAVSAESSEADRLMHLNDRTKLADHHQKVVETLREQHDQAIQQILVEKDVEHNKSCEAFKKQLNEVQLELLNNRQHTINTEAQWRKRVEDLEQRERAEMCRIRDHFQEQLSRAKSEAAAAHAAMGAASMVDGGRRGGVGGRNVPGSLAGAHGVDAGDVDASSDERKAKVRSLSLSLDESKKESKWLRERNQELERVVEALRKTIMRQAEISSQRPDPQGQRPPTHAYRSRQAHQDHHQQPQPQPPPPPPQSSGIPYNIGAGSRGSRADSYLDAGPATGRSSGHQVHGNMSREEEVLLQRQRHQGVGGQAGGRGSDDAYLHRHHPVRGGPGAVGGIRASGVSSSAAAAAAVAGGARGAGSSRSHMHQFQQHTDNPPYRRNTAHESYDESLMGSPAGGGVGGGGIHRQHASSNRLARDRGHGVHVPSYDRDMPDRSWSQSAPLPGNGNGPRNGSRSGPPGALASGGGSSTEYAAPVPRHHRQHDGAVHGGSAAAATSAASAAANMAANALLLKDAGGGGGGARWDRDPVRDTMAFATSKYPPGTFPPGGVFGEGAIFEQVPLHDGKRGNGGRAGNVSTRGLIGAGGGTGASRGMSDFQSPHARNHGMLTGNAAGGVAPGQRSHAGGGGITRSTEASPIVGAVNAYATSSTSHGSPAVSSGRGTPGLPPGLGDTINNPSFSPSGRSTGGMSAGSPPSYQAGVVGSSRPGGGGGGGGEVGGGGGGGGSEGGSKAVVIERDDFNFGEIDTAAVLGL